MLGFDFERTGFWKLNFIRNLVDDCLECRHNPLVMDWETKKGCAAPTCDAKLGIVDAWKVRIELVLE